MSASCCGGTDNVTHEKTNILTRIYDTLSGLTAAIAGGAALAASLIVVVILKKEVPVDPAWAAVVLCGYPLLYLAIWRIIFNKGMYKISSALLISAAMISAIFIDELFAAGQVAFIMAIGGILEDKTIERAKRGIKKLISLVPEQGRVIIDGAEKMIPIGEVAQGDILRVLPGEAIPVDGEIVYGNTSVDQSIITGESLPIDKTAGDTVFCGTINRFGSIDIRAAKVGEDSSLQKLIRLVREAEENKAPTQKIVDRLAVWLVPAALLIALVTYFITRDIIRAVTVAIVFCPCALALATPTSIMAAIGQAAKYGIIIKSGEALERMGKVDTIAFDKTGTLTHGRLVVSDVISFAPGKTDVDLLALTASAESHSEHPLGKAIVAYAAEQGLTIQPAENFVMLPGKGVSASVDNSAVMCGSSLWLTENGITFDSEIGSALERLRDQGKAAVLVSQNGECAGIVALSDTLRETAKGMVQELRKADTNAILLTGDHKQTADYFAGQAGIESVHAELLPAQKVERIQQLQSEGHSVCMIGDGVNDAPALKSASVGVAMGSMGSDIAIEAADIALMGDDISKIPYLKRLSNVTVKMIITNITISIVFNIAAITLSILGLLNPVTGALAHNFGAIAVVLNAALLYDRKHI
jgi:heavy metal translocating P-type ATPase